MVQPDKMVRTGQLRSGQRQRELTRRAAPPTRLEPRHRRVQCRDQPDSFDELVDREQPRRPRQRRVGRADPDLLPTTGTAS